MYCFNRSYNQTKRYKAASGQARYIAKCEIQDGADFFVECAPK